MNILNENNSFSQSPKMPLNASQSTFESDNEHVNCVEPLSEELNDDSDNNLDDETVRDEFHTNTSGHRVESGTQTFEPFQAYNLIDAIVNQGPERQAIIRLIVTVVQYMFTQENMLRIIVAIVQNAIGHERVQEIPVDPARRSNGKMSFHI